jgi:hypothetical protein
VQAEAEKPEQSRQKKNCLAMKTLNLEQMESVLGGQPAFLTGLMCGATVFLAFSVVFAPFAAATGTGCAVGLYALHTWKEQGIDVNNM